MTKANEVQGRPFWTRDESVEIQRLVVEHRLTRTQLKTLREYTPETLLQPRRLEHSTARALCNRGWGDITAKQMNRQLSRAHPKAQFVLNETGRAIVTALTRGSPDASPEGRAE